MSAPYWTPVQDRLRLLRVRGMSDDCLQEVFCSTVLAAGWYMQAQPNRVSTLQAT